VGRHRLSAETASLGDRAARGTGITLATQLLRALLQFGSVVVLARLLTPEDFGLVAMVTAVIGIADLVRDFGLSSAAIQTTHLSAAEKTNLFWANLGMGTACALVIAAVQPLIVHAYGEPRIAPVIYALAGVFVLSGACTQFRADLARSMRFGRISAADVVSQVCGIAVAAGLASQGAGPWALVGQQLTVPAVMLVMLVIGTQWRPGWPQRGVSLRRFYRFGGALFGTQSVAYAVKNADNVAIGAIWGAGPLGLYSRAYQLLMMPLNQINAPMTNVALPVLARVQDDQPRFQNYLSRAQLVACYFTAGVFAVAAGLAQPLVLVLFGQQWTGVAPIFAVLAIGGIFRAVAQIAYWIFLARGRPGAQLKQDLVLRPLMIVMILAGLPWGPLGVAVGHSIAFFLYWIATLLYVGRVTGVDVRPLFRNSIRSIVLVCAPAGVAARVAAQLPAPPLVQLAAGLVAAAGWLALVVAVVPAVRRDLAEVYRFARRAIGR
jgi:PST family polysaccharide transporter